MFHVAHVKKAQIAPTTPATAMPIIRSVFRALLISHLDRTTAVAKYATTPPEDQAIESDLPTCSRSFSRTIVKEETLALSPSNWCCCLLTLIRCRHLGWCHEGAHSKQR